MTRPPLSSSNSTRPRASPSRTTSTDACESRRGRSQTSTWGFLNRTPRQVDGSGRLGGVRSNIGNSPYRAANRGNFQACVSEVVQFRLRANQPSCWRAWEHIVPSFYNNSPNNTLDKTYAFIIDPQMATSSDYVELSFDIMSFNPGDNCNSSLYLNDVVLERIDIY